MRHGLQLHRRALLDETGHEAPVRALSKAMTLDERLGEMNPLAGGRRKALNSRIDALAAGLLTPLTMSAT